MQLQNYYYRFTSAVPKRICNEIIKIALDRKKQAIQAMTGSFSEKQAKGTITDREIQEIKKTRDSKILWMQDRWIFELMHPFIANANKAAGWNHEWSVSEQCQFTIYEPGQYYDWHCDSKPEPYETGLTRKLSVTLSLSDGKDYEGGELEFDYRDQNPDLPPQRVVCKEILPQGSLVVFPSFVWHRVRPVTSGTRYSLVIWSLGKPYK